MKYQERMVSQKPCEENVSKRKEWWVLKVDQRAYGCNTGGMIHSKKDEHKGKGHTVSEVVLTI